MRNPSGFCQCGCGEKTSIVTMTSKAEGVVKGEPRRFVKGHESRGRVLSPEHKAKIGEYWKGEKNPRWSGDEIEYRGLHNWIERHATKTGECSFCGFEGVTEWANISEEYRRDTDDFIELCKRCHTDFDRLKAVA